jgi:hypothetical protein
MFELFSLHIDLKMIHVQVVVHAVIPRAVKSRRRIRKTLATVCVAFPDPLAPWHLPVAPPFEGAVLRSSMTPHLRAPRIVRKSFDKASRYCQNTNSCRLLTTM